MTPDDRDVPALLARLASLEARLERLERRGATKPPPDEETGSPTDLDALPAEIPWAGSLCARCGWCYPAGARHVCPAADGGSP